MMNLELLFWATHESGDSSFYRIAVTHANTTMRNHFRPDYSSYHVVDYDTATGQVLARKTAQGYADSSAWARGQSWGLYGFTMVYRYTHDPKYLEQAVHIADYILPRLPADKVPYWDYDAPGGAAGVAGCLGGGDPGQRTDRIEPGCAFTEGKSLPGCRGADHRELIFRYLSCGSRGEWGVPADA